MRSSEQSNSLSLTFLGTGTSVGIPVIGCQCVVCLSDNPQNTRLRSSIFITYGDLHLLVDSGPDLRAQALRERITRADAVLYTHAHVDHVAGFDELRAFCWHREDPLPLYSSPECLEALEIMYPWAFHQNNDNKGYVHPISMPVTEAFELGGLAITPLDVIHGHTKTYGYKFEAPELPSIAYISDVKSIPDETFLLLEDIDLLIIDALRYTSHGSHMSLDEALEAGLHCRAKKIILTHIAHEIDADTVQLPEHAQLAYDGLHLTFTP